MRKSKRLSRIIFSGALFILPTLFGNVAAQSKSSGESAREAMERAYWENMTLKNPSLRSVLVSSEFIPHHRINSKLNGSPYFTGDADLLRNSVQMRFPVFKWNNKSIDLTGSALNQRTVLTEVESFYPGNIDFEHKVSQTSLGIVAGFTMRSKLFKKRIIYRINFSSLFDSDFSQSQHSLIGVGLISLKSNAYTSLSVGLAIIASPTVKIPVFGLVSYEHTFATLGLELSANLPYRLSLRKELTARSALSFVNELGGPMFFYQTTGGYTVNQARLNMTELRIGLLWERRLGKILVCGASFGCVNTFKSEIHNVVAFRDLGTVLKNEAAFDYYFGLNFSVLSFR